MIKLVGVHRLHDRNVIDNRGQMRQELRKLSARFSVARKLVRCAEHFRHALDESKTLLLEERFGARFAVQLLKLWFVIEKIKLRRRAGHVQINDVLGFGRKMRRFGSERIRRRIGGDKPIIQQRTKTERADADAAIAKEMPPRNRPQMFRITV